MNFLGSLLTPFVKAIADGIKQSRHDQAFEEVQAEVLSGWLFRIKTAVRDTCRKRGVSLADYNAIDAAISEVINENIDTKKL